MLIPILIIVLTCLILWAQFRIGLTGKLVSMIKDAEPRQVNDRYSVMFPKYICIPLPSNQNLVFIETKDELLSESEKYFERVMQDYNQYRNGRSFKRYYEDESVDYYAYKIDYE